MLVEIILKALELSYRHIDTAQFYDNEAEVGRALAVSGQPRDEVFLTTKVWHDRLEPTALAESVDRSLEALNVEAVDLLLIHWPSPGDEVAPGNRPPSEALTCTRRVERTRAFLSGWHFERVGCHPPSLAVVVSEGGGLSLR